MHVLYLFPHLISNGGASTFVLSTARKLVERGVDVTIIAQEGKEEIISSCKGVDFRFVGGPLPKSYRYWINYPVTYNRVRKEIMDISPDILFPQVFPANYWGFLYKVCNNNTKCIWYCHEPSAFIHDERVINDLPQNLKLVARLVNPLMSRVDIPLARMCDNLFVNSQFTANRVERIYGIKPKIIYPGSDYSLYPPSQENKQEYFLFVGRLTKFKNVDLLIKAIALLKERGLSSSLFIVGEGEESEALRNLSISLNVHDLIHFLGEVPKEHLISLYTKAYCVLFPSINEPFGLVPLEAQSAHTPVIAFRSGGCKETIVDGETGILVEPFTSHALADAMEFALTNNELMLSMGRKGRALVESKFSWSYCVDNLAGEFTSLVDSDR